jgi:hypothetical protein
MSTNLTDGPPRATYLLLLAVQITGAASLIWKELPTLSQLTLSPGEQIPYVPQDNFTAISALVAMQVAYWYRLVRVPIPFCNSNLLLNHLFLFLGRLSFIFGGTLFSVVVFRHLPQLDQGADILVMTRHGMLLIGSLFALFCFSVELERLGHSFGSNVQN